MGTFSLEKAVCWMQWKGNMATEARRVAAEIVVGVDRGVSAWIRNRMVIGEVPTKAGQEVDPYETQMNDMGRIVLHVPEVVQNLHTAQEVVVFPQTGSMGRTATNPGVVVFLSTGWTPHKHIVIESG